MTHTRESCATRPGPNTQHKTLYRWTTCSYPGTDHENRDTWHRYDSPHWVCERCQAVKMGQVWIDVYIDLRKVKDGTTYASENGH